jgi:hypothetical protein
MRASSERIVKAVEQLAQRLHAARTALGDGALVGELDAGAEALQAGVSPESLAKLRKDRPGQQLTVALGVLTDLIGSGVPANVATSSDLALTQAGIADEQLVAFRREVERDIGIGAPPAAAALLRATPSLSITGGTGAGSSGGTGKQRP